MRLIHTFIAAWLALFWASAVLAQTPGGGYKVISPSAEATSVTIYPDNLALITEVRTIDVPQGRSVLAFEGVSDLIIPQSMILREFSGFTLERNFDYDLISKASLFENAVGEVITLTRLDKASGAIRDTEARIISARPDGGVVIDVNGKTEVLMCSGLSERTLFDGLPRGLNPAPVMSIEVNAESAGTQEVVISYLTSGLGWRADYRLDLNDTQDKAKMLGWLTLTNGTAKGYANVGLSIIAGDLNRRPETRAVSPDRPIQRAQCYPKGSTKRGIADRVRKVSYTSYGGAGAPMMMRSMAVPEAAMMMADEVVVTGVRKMAVQENVGDYKLYRIPGAVNVAPYQTKQIAFVDNDDVDIDPYFLAEINGTYGINNPTALQTVYEIDNARDGTLGIALPKGTMRFFGRIPSGRVVYLGEDRINNLAVDEAVRLKLGQSFSVHMQGKSDGNEKLTRAHGSITVSNAFDTPSKVKIVVKDEALRGGVITSENRQREADEIEPTWIFIVPPESRESLSFGIGTDILYRLDLDPLDDLALGRINSGEDFVVESYAVIAGSQRPIEDVDLYIEPVEDTLISVATSVSNLREETVDGETYLLARVTHALKNNAAEARSLRVEPLYEDLDEDDVSFSDSTLDPVRAQGRWDITLRAGADKVLSYTVRLYQY